MSRQSLRVAFDLDGVLADFLGAYERIADELFVGWRNRTDTQSESVMSEDPAPGDIGGEPARRLSTRRQAAVWKRIRSTDDFWLTLDPIDPKAVSEIQERAASMGWDVFFVTQRPATAGRTVQVQTQRWLMEQGFALPSVIVHTGARGRLASALELDFLVDDSVQHCVDTLSSTDATPILVSAHSDPVTDGNARRLGLEVCSGARESLELIDRASTRRKLRSLARGVRDLFDL